MKKFTDRINSDRGAIGGVEMVIMAVLTIFMALVIQNSILEPAKTQAVSVGAEISKFKFK
mgnify:CR=1 FL=1